MGSIPISSVKIQFAFYLLVACFTSSTTIFIWSCSLAVISGYSMGLHNFSLTQHWKLVSDRFLHDIISTQLVSLYPHAYPVWEETFALSYTAHRVDKSAKVFLRSVAPMSRPKVICLLAWLIFTRNIDYARENFNFFTFFMWFQKVIYLKMTLFGELYSYVHKYGTMLAHEMATVWRAYCITRVGYFKFENYGNRRYLKVKFYGLALWSYAQFLTPRKGVIPRIEYFYHLENIIYTLFKSVIGAALVSLWGGFALVHYLHINLTAQLAVWAVVGFLFLGLISGFNFFLKRYQYSKFTSAVARFWKRANSYFWCIEGFLFLLFFYYYLNSSQEPNYMYDFSSLNQDYLQSLINTYSNYLPVIVLVFTMYYCLLNLNNFTNPQVILILGFSSCVFIFLFLVESYQFYYILTLFSEGSWVYDYEYNIFALEFEAPRTRVKQQYFFLALIAKYWHFIFIFISWVFFVMKVFEQGRSYYTLFGVNLQNVIILFGLNILCLIQWVKFLGKRYLETSYFWFFTDPNLQSAILFVREFMQLFTVL